MLDKLRGKSYMRKSKVSFTDLGLLGVLMCSILLDHSFQESLATGTKVFL